MVLLLLHFALTHVRNIELLGIIAPLLIAAPLAAQLGTTAPAQNGGAGKSAARGFAATPLVTAAIITGVITLGFLSTALALDRRGLRPRENVAPLAAVDAARAAGLHGPVLNSIRFGGYLMFAGIPTFVDGRADLFGDKFLARDAAASAGFNNALADLLDRYRITWTLFEPASPAVSLLDHLPGWQRLYSGADAVVHRRKMPDPK
jgi:hypothetical protein